MLYTIKQVKEFLVSHNKRYNIIYNEDSSKEFKLKGKIIKLPISKEKMMIEYKLIYKEK